MRYEFIGMMTMPMLPPGFVVFGLFQQRNQRDNRSAFSDGYNVIESHMECRGETLPFRELFVDKLDIPYLNEFLL